MTDKYTTIAGYCPACGGRNTIKAPRHATLGALHCSAEGCPDKMAVAKLLTDSEIHHIVRFDPDSDTFNAQHPLRERIGRSLLDCAIHEEIQGFITSRFGSGGAAGTWRVKQYAEGVYDWEQL